MPLEKRKRKEAREDPNLVVNGMFQCLVVNGEVFCLVANGRFQAWWPMQGSKLNGQWKVPMFGGQWENILLGGQWKVPMFGGPWKVPSLVAIGRKKINIFFTSFHFPPNKIYLNLFSLILRFYFTMVLYHYFTSFLPFP